MTALRPTDPGSLIQFPSDPSVIYEIFGCVRCKKIPNPEYFFICEEKGHRICAPCAFVVDAKAQAGEPCCIPDVGNLQKGPPSLLNTLLMNCKWECKFKNRGCTASIVGSDWSEHVKKCRFHQVSSCQFHGCPFEFISVEDGVNHLHIKHEAMSYDGPKVTFTIPFDELIKAHRMLALINWDGGCYLFACEISANTINMWVWNMQAYDYDDETHAIYKIELEAAHAIDDKAWKNPKSVTSFSGTCRPYKFSAAAVIDDEDCMGIPLVRFKKRFLKSEESEDVKCFTIAVLIRKLTIPESDAAGTKDMVETKLASCSLEEEK